MSAKDLSGVQRRLKPSSTASAAQRSSAAHQPARPVPLIQPVQAAPALLAASDMAQLQRSIGNHAAGQVIARMPSSLLQRGGGKGGKKEGTFIGDEASIHLHIDIGNPHLKVAGDRYDIKGTDSGGYSFSRCVNALDALTAENRSGVSGGTDCRNWLEDILDGETIPSVGTPGSINGSHWGQGVIKGFPARPFEKGQ